MGDLVEARARSTSNCFLKSVDRFNEWHISAFVTPGGAKFLMVHDHVNEDGIRNFFADVHEIWIRLRLNPFYQPDSEIKNRHFIQRVKQYGQRDFGTGNMQFCKIRIDIEKCNIYNPIYHNFTKNHIRACSRRQSTEKNKIRLI